MKSRLLAGVVAVIAALIGGVLVFTYAKNADARAVAAMDPVPVLIIQKPVPAGTTAKELSSFVTRKSLPASAVADNALKDLKNSAGKVTAVDLLAGEQLLADRLMKPENIQSGGSVDVPEGLQEVSFQLEPQRVVGGQLSPGDHVGVFISMESGASVDDPEASTTQLVLDKILVTAVQGAPAPVEASKEEDTVDENPLPSGSIMLTVAVEPGEAARIIYAAEFASIWLSKEPLEAKEGDGEIIQKSEVYR